MLRINKTTKKLAKRNDPQHKFLKACRYEQAYLHLSCMRSINPITSPLALISQIQRSGGSLLSQLFDGHPEIYAHPHELKIGYPQKHIWPKLNLNDCPEEWFDILFETGTIKHFRDGYTKGRKSEERFLFIFLVSIQKKIFLKYLDSLESIKLRDIFNAYMSSYFGSWLNYHNIYGTKRFITGFTPRLSMSEENMDSFFDIYPDGRLISIIRDPRNWYSSAVRHNKGIYGDVSKALNQWNESVFWMLKNKDKYNHRVKIICFEDLIEKTEPVMRSLANFLQIEFEDILLVPTFNKFPITANTSFQAEKPGIIKSTLSRHKLLSRQELDTIEEITKNNYEKVLNKSDRFGEYSLCKN